MMIIGLDFDDTLTKDPLLWRWFCSNANELGHTVHVVTCRRDTPDNRETVNGFLADNGFDLHVIYTNLRAKEKVCEERGVKVDVWIDDYPISIVEGR